MSGNVFALSNHKDEQELVSEDSLLKGKLTIEIVSVGQDAHEQIKMKKHIITEIERICSELSKDQDSF